MKMWNSKSILRPELILLIRRLSLALGCWFIDSFLFILGTGVRLQTTLILIYRWSLYTPSKYDIPIYILMGLLWDLITCNPLGFHSFLFLTVFILLQSQTRYLQITHQYLRWFIFLGVLIATYQFEYGLHFMLGQHMALKASLIYSVFLTFALYPPLFRFLQAYD